MIYRSLCWLFLIALVLSCAKKEGEIQQIFETRRQQIRQVTIPDPALDVFAAVLEKANAQWHLRGETTRPVARDALIALADSLLGPGKYQNELLLLPDPALGDSNLALVQVSVTPLRDAPRHAAQIVDQTIMGRTLRLLKKQGGWYLVQTDYDYIGWVDSDAVVRTDRQGVAAWQNAPTLRVIDLFPLVYSLPDEQSEPITDVVLNAELKNEGRQKGWYKDWYKVSTPDGRSGYIHQRHVTTQKPGEPGTDRLRAAIVRIARSMMGIPYLWGGNSTKGNDCSGFTQTVFKANGIDLPRDSRQQALLGDPVLPEETWSNVLPGDLLFFGNGERVTHVGISLGGREFIDQGGKVAVSSLDPQSDHYNEYRHKTLMKVMRIIK